ncbi:MAG: rhamnulokinase [Candidatus Latescibacteria bacterium]|nr:rhamnulokinase [Candidatus Latescibacterota bacterium]
MNFLAFDLGAESGRAVIGRFDGERLGLEEVHRFPNGPVRLLDGLHWDVLRLFEEMKRGLGLCVKQAGRDIAGLGIDTWGVDFALLDRTGALLGNPCHYRDSRTDGMLEEAFRRVPKRDIFAATGVQFLKLNTLYQILAMSVRKSPLLDAADTFLMIPDLFNYWLTGRKVCEFTDATTTQFYDPAQRDWSRALFGRLGLPAHILPEIVPPGTPLGPLIGPVAEETGARGLAVIAPACHDTGSAVAAVPAGGEDYAYISSGTWSLMGVEVRAPILTDAALNHNFTNEGGVEGTFRFLKNIMGLWLVQECRRAWEQEGDVLNYDDLTRLASEAPAFGPIVDPDDDRFVGIGDMPGRIRAFCEETGQAPPADRGAFVRCALESLALKYRYVLERLEEIQGHRLSAIHIVGGGSRNHLLCQLTADAAGRPVIAGPVEATAIGNLLVQAIATGHLGALSDARAVVRRSFDVVTYEPKHDDRWDEAYARFVKMI